MNKKRIAMKPGNPVHPVGLLRSLRSFAAKCFFAVRQWICGRAPKPAIPRLTRFATKLPAMI
jgi:hypothetical protein